MDHCFWKIRVLARKISRDKDWRDDKLFYAPEALLHRFSQPHIYLCGVHNIGYRIHTCVVRKHEITSRGEAHLPGLGLPFTFFSHSHSPFGFYCFFYPYFSRFGRGPFRFGDNSLKHKHLLNQ